MDRARKAVQWLSSNLPRIFGCACAAALAWFIGQAVKVPVVGVDGDRVSLAFLAFMACWYLCRPVNITINYSLPAGPLVDAVLCALEALAREGERSEVRATPNNTEGES